MTALAAALLLLAAGAPSTLAQDGQDLALAPTLSPQGLLSDQLVLVAQAIGAAGGKPRDDQFQRMAILLDLALQITPDDAELWRLRHELAGQMDDTVEAGRANANYLRLRPDDDAAQLTQILSAVGRKQTVDARLDAVDQLLRAPGAEKLSPALRSRLATYVAQGALELGDTRRFAERLVSAVRLDSTNKQAALMTLQTVTERKGSPFDVGVAMAGVMRADPVDASVHRAMGDLLVSQAAYARAAGQFRTAMDLPGPPNDVNFIYNWALAEAAQGQAARALELLASYEASLPVDPDRPVAPTDLRLPIELELLRMAVHVGTGDTARAEGSFGRVSKALLSAQGEQLVAAQADYIGLALTFNFDVNDAVKTLANLSSIKNDDAVAAALPRLRALEAVRRDEPAKARALLEPLASSDPLAHYGLAQTHTAGDAPRRRELLTSLVHKHPSHIVALLAARELASGQQQDVPPTADGARLVDLLSRWPIAIVEPNLTMAPRTQMAITLEPPSYRYLEPITAQVTLRNATDLPVALGPQGPTPTLALLLTSPRAGGVHMGDLPPMVVDLQRRLRLEPRESLTVPVRLDRQMLGTLLSTSPGETLTFTVQAVLAPSTEATGKIIPGLLGTTAWVNLAQRRGLQVTPANFESWITGLADPDPVERYRSLARLAVSAGRLGDTDEAQALAQKAADAVGQTYQRLDPQGQAWTVRFLSPGDEAGRLFGTVVEHAARSDVPVLRIMCLATRVTDPASPLLDDAIRHTNPTISAYATAMRTGLEAQAIEQANREAEEKARQNK